LDNKKIIVKVDRWSKYSKYPLGHFVSVIGDIGDPYTEGNVILLEHNVEIKNFSKHVMDCLPADGVLISSSLSFDNFRKIGKYLKKNIKREQILETIMYVVLTLLAVKTSMMLCIATYYQTEIIK